MVELYTVIDLRSFTSRVITDRSVVCVLIGVSSPTLVKKLVVGSAILHGFWVVSLSYLERSNRGLTKK